MVKRVKRLEKGIESLKEEIEEHFNKLDQDILEKEDILAGYHVKEIDKSLIRALEHKMSLIDGGNKKEHIELINEYKKRLEDYKKKLDIM